jgi:hypothetical protein
MSSQEDKRQKIEAFCNTNCSLLPNDLASNKERGNVSRPEMLISNDQIRKRQHWERASVTKPLTLKLNGSDLVSAKVTETLCAKGRENSSP